MSETVAAPRYSRPVPSEWDGLVSFASQEVTANPDLEKLTTANATAMFSHLNELENERIDVNRYYGIGLVMCGMARALQDQAVRQTTVDWAARNMAESYWEWSMGDRRGIRPGDLSSFSTGYPFQAVAMKASHALPAPTRLVTDSLVSVANFRQGLVENPNKDCSSEPYDFRLKKIIEGKPAADAVGLNAAAATTVIIRHALLALQTVEQSDVADFDAEKGTIIEPEELAKLDLKRVATGCARLRLDEFARDEEFYGLFSADEAGKLHFLREKVPVTPPPLVQAEPPGNAQLHTDRLACPAVHVRGLIPLMLDIVPEIIEQAQKNIRRRNEWRLKLNAY